jgi:hypothetical protein
MIGCSPSTLGRGPSKPARTRSRARCAGPQDSDDHGHRDPLDPQGAYRVGRDPPVERDTDQPPGAEPGTEDCEDRQHLGRALRAKRTPGREEAECALETAVHGAHLGATGRRLEEQASVLEEAGLEQAEEPVGQPDQGEKHQHDSRHGSPPPLAQVGRG